jgi:hypothetical protein
VRGGRQEDLDALQHERPERRQVRRHLKSIGLDEEHGFSGALAEIRDLMLSRRRRRGGPERQVLRRRQRRGHADAQRGHQRVFKAIELSEDGKVKLGQKITQPATTVTTRPRRRTATGEVKLGDDGKPLPEAPEKAFEELSDDEQDAAARARQPGAGQGPRHGDPVGQRLVEGR